VPVCSFEDAGARPGADSPTSSTRTRAPCPTRSRSSSKETEYRLQNGNAASVCRIGSAGVPLGEIFGVSDRSARNSGCHASELPARSLSARPGATLTQYLRGNCSLVNPRAACQCVKKTRAFIQGVS